jgi:hypothetical protein
MADRYALRDHDGTTWWLYLPELGAGVPYVLGDPDEPLEPAQVRGWWRVPSWVDFDPATAEVYVLSPPREETVGYQLTIETPDFPARLTVEDWRERTDDEHDRYDRRIASLYTPIRETRDPVRTRVEEDWLVLDGTPPPKDGYTWNASLPNALRNAPEYHHLFPGNFAGLREAVARAFLSIENVQAFEKPNGVEVYLHVDAPRKSPIALEVQPPTGTSRERRLRAASRAAKTTRITRHLFIPVPREVHAANRAEGRLEWDAYLESIVEYVTGIVAKPCPTCHGHGWLEEGAP